MPFDEDENEVVTKQSALKTKRSPASENLPKKPTQEQFQRAAENKNEKINSHAEKLAELAVNFSKSLKDQTVPANKSPIARQMEQDIISKMSTLASTIDNDDNESLGVGSLAWITLLLKCTLYQRDRINDLEYQLYSLKKAIKPNEP